MTAMTTTPSRTTAAARNIRNKSTATTAAAYRQFNGYFRLVSQTDYDQYLKIIGLIAFNQITFSLNEYLIQFLIDRNGFVWSIPIEIGIE